MLNFINDRHVEQSILAFIDLCCLFFASFFKSFFSISRSSRVELLERDKEHIEIVAFVTSLAKDLRLLNVITFLYQSIRRNIVRKVRRLIDLRVANRNNTKRFIDLRIASRNNTRRFIDLRIASRSNTRRLIDLRIASRNNTRRFFDLRINDRLMFDSRSSHYLFQFRKLILRIICCNIKILI